MRSSHNTLESLPDHMPTTNKRPLPDYRCSVSRRILDYGSPLLRQRPSGRELNRVQPALAGSGA